MSLKLIHQIDKHLVAQPTQIPMQKAEDVASAFFFIFGVFLDTDFISNYNKI